MKMFAINLIEKEQGFEVELPTIKQIYSKIHKIKHKTYDASNKRWYILPESLLEFINSVNGLGMVRTYYKNNENEPNNQTQLG
jgi:hypothetical protein